MIRTVAITGRTDTINTRLAGRQGGRWAEQTIRAAFPAEASRTDGRAPDPAAALRDLTELRRRGVVTDDEFEDLRAGLGD